MNSYEQVSALLNEKKGVLAEIEQVSSRMKLADAQEIIELFAERGKLLESAQALTEQIRALSEGDEKLASAISNSAEPSALDGELLRIFEVSLGIKAVINRVLHEEEGIKEHIQTERDGLLEKIEGLNASSSAVAAGYRRSVQTGVSQSRLQGRSKSI